MNQLVSIQPHTNVEAYRASTDAADLCREIVTKKAMTIQNRRYVNVEGWQAIAVAHGCMASARAVEKVDGGVRAIGEVRRMSDGVVLAEAEGFVGEDEPTWYGGTIKTKWGEKELPKRPDYAIRAMAQTRAISRACRSAFAHVVVMIDEGLSTTPYEEVPAGGFTDEPHDPRTGEIIEGAPEQREKVPGIHKIKQRLRAFKQAGSAPDMTLEQFRKLVHENRADLKAIRDGKHEWWTGDGGEDEGFERWLERRYAELTPQEESETFRQLSDTLDACETQGDLVKFAELHGDAIEMLDGAESRTFQLKYDLKASCIQAMDNVTAGA